MHSSVLNASSTIHLTEVQRIILSQVNHELKCTKRVEYSWLGALNSTQWRSHLSKNCGVIVNIFNSLSTGFILKSLTLLSSSHPCVFAPVFLTFVQLYFSYLVCMCSIRVTENMYTLRIFSLSTGFWSHSRCCRPVTRVYLLLYFLLFVFACVHVLLYLKSPVCICSCISHFQPTVFFLLIVRV